MGSLGALVELWEINDCSVPEIKKLLAEKFPQKESFMSTHLLTDFLPFEGEAVKTSGERSCSMLEWLDQGAFARCAES
jgi:hypothetical protein